MSRLLLISTSRLYEFAAASLSNFSLTFLYGPSFTFTAIRLIFHPRPISVSLHLVSLPIPFEMDVNLCVKQVFLLLHTAFRSHSLLPMQRFLVCVSLTRLNLLRMCILCHDCMVCVSRIPLLVGWFSFRIVLWVTGGDDGSSDFFVIESFL